MAQGWRKDYLRYKGFFLDILAIYNSKPNLKAYLELILSLGTIIIFSIYAIKPTILTIVELNNEIKSKENTVSLLTQKISNLKIASNILQKESQNLELIDSAIPTGANVEQLVKQIEKIAFDSSVVIRNFSSANIFLKGSSDKKVENELPVSFSVTGNYQNLFLFLQTIENLRRPFRIDSFVFNSNITADNEKFIVLTISGNVPYEYEEK
ncbi:MAG: type 4a pilus biogenesis protein PilO [Patescibacteria group bacterium]